MTQAIDEPEDRPPDPRSVRRKPFSGTRGLLAIIVLVALGLAWLVHEHQRAERRTVLVSELARTGVYPMLNEPTYVGQIVKKFWPSREVWLRGQIGSGWFDHPSIFVGDQIDDDRVPGIARRFWELGIVNEVHYGGDRLTEAGIAKLRDGLPGVNVVPRASPQLHRYFLALMGTTHTAHGALGFMIAVATILIGLLVFAIRWLARRLRATAHPLS